jgi:hypothetical protein
VDAQIRVTSHITFWCCFAPKPKNQRASDRPDRLKMDSADLVSGPHLAPNLATHQGPHPARKTSLVSPTHRYHLCAPIHSSVTLVINAVQCYFERTVTWANWLYLSYRYQVRGRSTTWTSASHGSTRVALAQVRRPRARYKRTCDPVDPTFCIWPVPGVTLSQARASKV